MYLSREQIAIIKKINKLKKEKNAIILVHNYQKPEIYRIADYIGDSLELSRKATETGADYIIFCGVDFMAETAYILNPEKTVLIPTAAVVSYVNTTAEIKAESDICCTSANAVKVINSLNKKDVIFVPDKNLASYVARYTDKNIIPWDGWCYVHSKFFSEDLELAKRLHPDAKVIAHPECRPEIIDLADTVYSTSGMINYVKNSSDKKFIIATEIGVIERLKLEAPEKICYQAPPGGVCAQMKKNSLELVLESLEKEQYKVTIAEDVRIKAKKALDRMLEVS